MFAMLTTSRANAHAPYMQWNEADKAFASRRYAVAAELYEEVYASQQDYELTLRLAECYEHLRISNRLLYYCERLILYSAHTRADELRYMRALLLNQRYTEAKAAGSRFHAVSQQDIALIKASADSAIKWNRQPKPYLITWLMNTPNIKASGASFSLFDPMNFGENIAQKNTQTYINTEGSDWGLENLMDGSFVYCSDGRQLKTVLYGELSEAEAHGEPKLYISNHEGSAHPFFSPSEANPNEISFGAPVFSADESEIFYAAINTKFNKHAGLGTLFSMFNTQPRRLGIYMRSRNKRNGTWSQPKPISINNEKLFSVFDPCLSPDGRYLYFASDMPDGSGAPKLYRAQRNESGDFEASEMLDESINAGDEKYTSRFPRFDPAGNFYFSTDALPGLGGLDIFKVVVKDGKWEKPRNMAVPFNSSSDDFAPTFISTTSGFFASNRPGGRGRDDIYAFDLSPAPITFHRMADESEIQPEVMLGMDDPIVVYKRYVLKAVRFDKGKWDIRREASRMLSIVAALLRKYPSMVIEIGVHTDNSHSRKYNITMSQMRAQAIKRYLEERFDIAEGRIVPMGYGDTNPLSPCGSLFRRCTDEDNKMNTRTELMVLKK